MQKFRKPGRLNRYCPFKAACRNIYLPVQYNHFRVKVIWDHNPQAEKANTCLWFTPKKMSVFISETDIQNRLTRLWCRTWNFKSDYFNRGATYPYMSSFCVKDPVLQIVVLDTCSWKLYELGDKTSYTGTAGMELGSWLLESRRHHICLIVLCEDLYCLIRDDDQGFR